MASGRPPAEQPPEPGCTTLDPEFPPPELPLPPGLQPPELQPPELPFVPPELHAPEEPAPEELPLTVTVSAMVVAFVTFPPAPAIVIVPLPVADVGVAVNTTIALSLVVLGLANVAVRPGGSPEAEKATAPEKPFERCTEMVEMPFPPCASVTAEGDAESEKLALPAAATDR